MVSFTIFKNLSTPWFYLEQMKLSDWSFVVSRTSVNEASPMYC